MPKSRSTAIHPIVAGAAHHSACQERPSALGRTAAQRQIRFVLPKALPRAHVLCVIDPAREYIVLDRAAASFEPGQKAGSHVARDLELDWPPRLLLDYGRRVLISGQLQGNAFWNPDAQCPQSMLSTVGRTSSYRQLLPPEGRGHRTPASKGMHE